MQLPAETKKKSMLIPNQNCGYFKNQTPHIFCLLSWFKTLVFAV